jgi:hypothetical protein
MPIFVFNFRRRQSEVFNSVGILDQISISRNPATADLKQNQYSTKMVQFGWKLVTKVYYFASEAWRD